MQARRIKKSYRNPTGLLPTLHNTSLQYESLLERDRLILISDDPNVEELHVQPVTILYRNATRETRYTPDLLIRWRTDRPEQLRVPLLEEMKYSSDLEKQREKLQPGLDAGQAYAAAQGWNFQITTEQQIRGVPLENARLLLPFRRHSAQVEPRFADHLQQRLAAHGPLSIDELIKPDSNLSDLHHRLRQVWILIARHQLGADRSAPLTRKTVVTPQFDPAELNRRPLIVG